MLSIPSLARAGVWYTSDLEAVALGQAGAFVAAPTTLSAAWYNPAGLAKQRGLQVQLEGGLIASPLTYDIAGQPRVENITPLLPAGLFGASYDFGVPNLAIGLVAYVPQSNRYGFDPHGPQRYQSISSNSVLAFFHAMAAYRFFDRLSVGVALGPTYFSSTQVAAVSAALFGNPTDPAWDVAVKTSVHAPLLFSGTVGLSLDVAPWMTFGASVMPGFDVKATGTIDITLPPILATVANVNGTGVTVLLHVPTIARAGVRLRPTQMLSFELAAVFENWSSLRAIDVQPDVAIALPALGLAPLPIGALTQVKHYHDVYSARVGGELQPLRWLTARAGTFVETSASDPSVFDLSTPESFKVGITCGASVQLGRFSIDAAYGHTFIAPLTVTNSTQTVQNVLVPSNTKSIANGVYRFSFDMVHVGVRFRLDPH